MTPSNVTISWESNSNEFLSGIQNNQIQTSGGNYYNIEAAKILKNCYNFKLDERFVRKSNESIFHYYFRVRGYKSDGKIIVKDPYIISFGNNSRSSVNIGMVHHLDFIKKEKNIKNWLYFTKLESNLRKLDHVVTVSKFWQSYINKIGCTKSSVIYNSFNLDEFEFKDYEIDHFKKKYKIDDKRAIIYLGINEVGKGYHQVVSKLRSSDYLLITTGTKSKSEKEIICMGFLPRRDYLILLHIAKVVISYSTLPEGWNRIAHEAMLCKTPVIGSGIAGMSELLENGGQKIINNLDKIHSVIEDTISKRQNLARDGFNYVKQYDMDYFKRSWFALIDSYMGTHK